MIPDQEVEFKWQDIPSGLNLEAIRPAIEVDRVKLSRQYPHVASQPYLSFDKKETFLLNCTLRNAGDTQVSGYVEAFLSEIGEPQPWKNFEVSSDLQEFFLEGAQTIRINIPINTGTLTGDHQLSYWIFTRQDLPFSPQNGGWFNKQVRVSDPKLGIHPIYGIEIP
jgi:hypothetical protein